MPEIFTQTERTIGKRHEVKTGQLMVNRVGKTLTLVLGIHKENAKRSYLETAAIELTGPELKRFKKAIRGVK